MATLVSHGIEYGGTFSDSDPSATNVTLNTIGATFILVSYCADALQGQLDPFSDSEGNVWTRLTNLGSSPYFPLTAATAAFYWVETPITSATHTFTTTNIAGSAHAVMEVMAWSGITVPSFASEDWTLTGLTTLSVGPTTAVPGIAFAVGCISRDPVVEGTVNLTTTGWTTLDSLPATTFAHDFSHCGMTVAYKVYGLTTTGVTNDWTNTSTENYIGAGIFPVSFAAPSPPAPATTYPIRRLRRFAPPWDDANREKYISRLEIVMQTGIGLISGQGSDPIVMLRVSKDGGKTWGTEIQMAAGEIGQYSARVYVNRLGRARNPVFEVSMSDPCDWQMIQAIVDIEEGTS